MIIGAKFLWFLLSFGGFLACLVVAATWLFLQPRRRAPWLALGAVLLTYSLLGSYGVAELAAAYLEAPFRPLTRSDVPDGRTAVVVLGSGSWTFVDWQGRTFSTLDPIGMRRALEGARVFRLLDAEWIISSGGSPDEDDQDQPSGLTMRQFLVRRGIPSAKVREEHASRTTREEAVIVARMLQQESIQHVVLVTSALHMRRSLAAFRAVGLQPIPAIARDRRYGSSALSRFFPSWDGLDLSAMVAHEVAGLVYYRLRGWQS